MKKLMYYLFFCAMLSRTIFAQQAIHFANKGYIEVPSDSSFNVTSEITLEMWVRIDSLDAVSNGVAGTWDDNSGSFRTYAFWFRGSKVEFLYSRNASESPRVEGIIDISDEWIHLAGTYDGTQVRLFINDSLYSFENTSGTLATNNKPLFIGKTETGSNGPDYFDGAIDELRIWNVARSSEQIITTMNDTLGPKYYTTEDSGLVAYYRFDELEDLGINGDGVDDIRDYSVYGNHGDIVGNATLTDPVTVSGLPDLSAKIPTKYTLNQNYPNPFNPVTIISWQLAVGGEVDLSIYNLLGQKIVTLVSAEQKAGFHQIEWRATDIPSGIYFYVLTTDKFQAVKKMVLLQ